MLFSLSAVVLVAASFLGGATQPGFLGDVIVQLSAVPLLLASCWFWARRQRSTRSKRRSADRLLLSAGLLFLVTVILQLLPLPPSWLADSPLAKFKSLIDGGILPDSAWHSMSLTADRTWAAAVSLIPPFAICLGMSWLDEGSRTRLVHLIIGLGAAGLLVGFVQVAQGSESPLRLYEITNPAEAVGFFANRNHFAAQLYTTLIFVAVWFSVAARKAMTPGANDTPDVIWAAVAAALLLATVTGLTLARSRAGLMLGVAALIGIAAILPKGPASRDRDGSPAINVWRISLAALSLAVLFAVQFDLQRMMTRFNVDPLDDLRLSLTPATLKLALENLPFGTGLGSFVPVYAIGERTEALMGTYVNRAHNDWAEFFLETGLFGGVIAALFLFWFVRRAIAVWRPRQPDVGDRYLALQRGATLAIGLLLVHSTIDYPLRTTSVATIFAFVCGLLLLPPEHESENGAVPHKRASKPRPARPAAQAQALPPEKWGTDVKWPDAWNNLPSPPLANRKQ